jgi:hypothetical protein
MANDPDDFLCVLRASSRAHGLGALLKTFPRWKPEAAWKAGAPAPGGRTLTHNGFTIFLAEGGEWRKVMAATRRRLRALTPMIEMGREYGASFQLAIAVMLGGSRFVTRSALLGSDDLKLLGALDVEVCVTAYPVSEEPARKGRPTRAR